MPRACTICTHPARREIDSALVAREPYRAIACRHSVGRESLRRHSREHLPALLVRAHDAELAADADELLARVQRMTEKLEAWIDRAERSYDYKEVRAFAAEWRQQIELLAKLAGQLASQQTTVNFLISPQWLELKLLLVEALDPHPAAKRDVLRATEEGTRNGR